MGERAQGEACISHESDIEWKELLAREVLWHPSQQLYLSSGSCESCNLPVTHRTLQSWLLVG